MRVEMWKLGLTGRICCLIPIPMKIYLKATRRVVESQDTRRCWFIDGIHRGPKLYSIKRFCDRVPVLFVTAVTAIDGDGMGSVMEDVLATCRRRGNILQIAV